MITLQADNPASNPLRWYNSDVITVPHAMLTSAGGFSSPPFTGLNLGCKVGDIPDLVGRNRHLLKQNSGIHHLVSATQVHGNTIVFAENIKEDTEFNGADSLITSQAGVGLLIQQADCQAILLHDPVQETIAAIHNGWKGSVLNIAAATVAAMTERYAVKPADLRAVISPSLGPCCAEFINFRLELPVSFHTFQVKPCYFDFWQISRHQLVEAGLQEKNIDITGVCTACSDEFFSYRRAVKQGDGRTGRNGSVIVLL